MSHFKRWGAAYILLVLFLGSWVGQFVTQVLVQQEPFMAFLSATFENWQSEWLQLLLQAILLLALKHKLYQADAEDIERIEKKVDRIANRIGVGNDSW